MREQSATTPTPIIRSLHLFDIDVINMDYRVMRSPEPLSGDWEIDHTDCVIWISASLTGDLMPHILVKAIRHAWCDAFDMLSRANDERTSNENFDPHGHQLARSLFGLAGVCWNGYLKQWICPACGRPFRTPTWFAKHVETTHNLDGRTLAPLGASKEAA